MGLISRVSSRTYRNSSRQKHESWSSPSPTSFKRSTVRARATSRTTSPRPSWTSRGADNATKEQLMQLHLVAVKEMDVGGRSALALMVPSPQVGSWQKIQTKIVRELEKKFSGKHVMIIGQRKVMAQEARKAGAKCYKQKRPISRSVKA